MREYDALHGWIGHLSSRPYLFYGDPGQVRAPGRGLSDYSYPDSLEVARFRWNHGSTNWNIVTNTDAASVGGLVISDGTNGHVAYWPVSAAPTAGVGVRY